MLNFTFKNQRLIYLEINNNSSQTNSLNDLIRNCVRDGHVGEQLTKALKTRSIKFSDINKFQDALLAKASNPYEKRQWLRAINIVLDSSACDLCKKAQNTENRCPTIQSKHPKKPKTSTKINSTSGNCDFLTMNSISCSGLSQRNE
jgi:hypothetical protein